MTIEQLLDLGDGLAELSDETLTAHLGKYFTQTRANAQQLLDTASEAPPDLPDFLAELVITRIDDIINL